MKQYHDLLRHILENGTRQTDRTGVGTISVFGYQMRFDLQAGFPAVTTKKLHFRSIIHELLWFLRGDTNTKYLKDNGVSIWDEWIKTNHDVGFGSDYRPLMWVEKKQKNYVNYNGNFSSDGLNAGKNTVDDKLRGIWERMMKRCYDSEHHRYHLYGAKGVFVDVKWHDCRTFVNEVKNLPNWHHKYLNWNDYELDKDYYASNCYSADTCVWLHTAENNYYTNVARPFTVTNSDGYKTTHLTLSSAVREIDISRSTLHRILKNDLSLETLKGKNKKFRNWKFEYIKENPGRVLRLAFSNGDLGPIYGKQWVAWETKDGRVVNQIAEIIEEIKRNPHSRRLIVSAWNVGDLKEMALMPCHALFQFYVADGKLSCQLYQRSADTLLGVPYNIASYAILTQMIAEQCDLTVGDFVWTGGDCHIYLNHLEQVKLQLTREPFPLPRLIVKRRPASVFDYRFDDFEIADYQSHAPIAAPIAV